MKTCSTCKWWGLDSEEYESHRDLGIKRCGYVEMYDNVTEWSNKEEPYDCKVVLKKEYADRKAFAYDGSSYIAGLLTMGTFGCMAHDEPPK